MPGTPGPGDEAPERIFMMTPPDWVHLDLSGDPLANARRMVDRIAEGGPPDKAKLKLRIAAALQGAVRDAVNQGAVMASVWWQVFENKSVGASAMVAVRPMMRDALNRDGTIDITRAVRTVSGAVNAGDQILEAEELALPAGPAYRVRKVQEAGVLDKRHETAVIQYFVPVPNTLKLLLITFSTPSLELIDSFVALFDAMAHSLRWRS
jgi:hypothetical protein